MQSFGDMQSMATNILSAYASMATSLMLFRTIGNDLVPEVVKSFFYLHFSRFFEYFIDRFFGTASNRLTFVVDEYSGFSRNQIYDAAEVYLRTKINPDTRRLKVSKGPKQNAINLSMEKDQEVLDWYQGFQLEWRFILITPERSSLEPETRYFELTFDRPGRDAVINHYLPFVLDKAKEIKANQRAIKLFCRHCPFDLDDYDEGGNGSSYWGCINLDHPVTFDKLAMEPNLKQEIIEDLDRFVKGKDYYKKVGKAWKRGYLLYGPPGTGKSSLVAAMANYLRFDVYYVELNNLYSNSELRRILLNTNNRSIILIEDIDCSSQTHDREKDGDRDSSTSDKNEDASNTRLTLSGLLNFMDGLWSSCGDERIVIFTTNHKAKLDPALLRPGRMDMHIHMGYCSPTGFDVLALNYLGTSECDHPELFLEIKGLIQEVEITPAEIAEHLMRKEEAVPALKGVVDLLNQKKDEKIKGDGKGGGGDDVHGHGNATNQGKKSGSGKSFRGGW